jgi:hypothetical protein
MTAPDTVIDDAVTEEMRVGAGGGGALFTLTVTGRAAVISPAVLRATAARVWTPLETAVVFQAIV